MEGSSMPDSRLNATGAQLLARGLKDLGITRIFGLCGDQVNAIFNALNEEGIEIIGTRHETAAVHMADCVGTRDRENGCRPRDRRAGAHECDHRARGGLRCGLACSGHFWTGAG